MSAAVPARPGSVALPGQRAVDSLISAQSEGRASESPTQIAIDRLKKNRLAHVATAIFVSMLLACIAAPWFESHWAGRTYDEQNLSGSIDSGGKKKDVVDLHGVPAVGPGLHRQYTMGADALGRDMFMRILRGGRISLLVGLVSAIITTFGAVVLGIVAAFKRGWWDTAISRYFEIQMAFPVLILGVALASALATSEHGFLFIKRGSVWVPIVIIGIVGIPGLGRIVRAQVLSIAEQEFVEAARALGAKDTRIMFNEILPNIMTTILTYFALIASGAIVFEAALSFLGIGVLPPTPSWGNLIADGKTFYSTAWWISCMPGVAIMVTVATLNLMGESLKDAFDPKALGGK